MEIINNMRVRRGDKVQMCVKMCPGVVGPEEVTELVGFKNILFPELKIRAGPSGGRGASALHPDPR